MTDYRLPFVNIDETGTEHVTYQSTAMEENKPYYIHWEGADWAVIKRKDKVEFYKKEMND